MPQVERVEKTAFISYRRTNLPWALAIFQNLTNNGFDVFFDYEGIASGDFEGIILDNICSRVHFIVLLTPSALERCNEPGDWLRREIEAALDSGRNTVPLMLEGFDFGTPSIASQLTGKLATLKQYNALSIPPAYFMEAMERLRTRFLNIPLKSVRHPASASAQQVARQQKVAAGAAPVVREEELTEQKRFEHAFATANSLQNRGILRYANGNLDGALQDYEEAIRLKADFAPAYYGRALIFRDRLNPAAAIADFQRYLDLGGGEREGFAKKAKQMIAELKQKL